MKGCHKCQYNGKGNPACLSCDMQQETYSFRNEWDLEILDILMKTMFEEEYEEEIV